MQPPSTRNLRGTLQPDTRVLIAARGGVLEIQPYGCLWLCGFSARPALRVSLLRGGVLEGLPCSSYRHVSVCRTRRGIADERRTDRSSLRRPYIVSWLRIGFV